MRVLKAYKKTVSIVDETAIELYKGLGREHKGFLMESNDKENGRYTFMGVDPEEIIQSDKDSLVITRADGTKDIRYGNPLERLKEYFDERGEGGFNYAYQYPGMNKVMQAAGRVIRTVKDKGVIALLDDRFLLPEYVALFPREWESYTVVNRFNVKQAVDGFWEQFV